MTTAELDPEFPSESTALNVTVVVPRGNTAGASFETETTPSPASTALAPKNALSLNLLLVFHQHPLRQPLYPLVH